MRNVILGSLAVVSLSACTTTHREEVRNDRAELEDQRKELRAAERDGTINQVHEEREDVAKAQQELREDQKVLYRPGSDGAPGEGLRVGQQDTGNLYAVPLEYQSQYRDGDGSYYRFDGARIYQIGSANREVLRVHALTR